MLLRSWFLILLIVLLCDAVIHAAMALGAAAVHRRALIAASTEMTRGATTLQQSIALHSAIPAPSPTCVASGANGCSLVAITQILLANPPSPVPSPLPCPKQDCTAFAQGNDVVAEGRINATISTTITATDGTVLARRSALVTFRTLSVPPYAALVGSLDATVGEIATNGAGDDGGAVPQGPALGTLIDVLDRNASTGALTPANVWLAHTQNAASVMPAWEP